VVQVGSGLSVSAGVVSTPYAYINGYVSTSSGGSIFGLGSSYVTISSSEQSSSAYQITSGTTGITVNVNGLYMFTANIALATPSGYMSYGYYRSGTFVAVGYMGNSNNQCISNCMSLNANDQICIYTQTSGIAGGTSTNVYLFSRSNFSVSLLRPY
jgi:hypothetical protein